MKRILTSVALAGLIATNSFAMDAKTAKVSKDAVIKTEKNSQQKTKLVKEAINAIRNTQDALIYLEGKDNKNAINALKKASENLAVVLNSPNSPYLLPVDINLEAYQFQGNIKTVDSLVQKAKTLVMTNKLPKAREVLNTLRDEIAIKTINLPLATYPAALKLAIKYINENKAEEAKEILSMALSTLVEIKTIIPIPLVKAQNLITESSKIVTTDPQEAIKYLNESKIQLHLSRVLGYTSTSSTTYKMLKNKIDNLENKIKAKHQTNNLFERLIDKIKEFKNKAITQTSK